MFQPTPKRCFTIESLVAKDNPVPASRSEEPIRPAALSYANSGQMNPFLNGFHSSGRGVYSNPDLVFAEAVSHPPNSAVPVHSVAPPHALAAHPLTSSHSPHPLFGSQQRDPSTFYPWLLHRYRYLGHRFQGKLSKCFHLTHFYAQNMSSGLEGFSWKSEGRRWNFKNLNLRRGRLCFFLTIKPLPEEYFQSNYKIVSTLLRTRSKNTHPKLSCQSATSWSVRLFMLKENTGK